MSPRACLRAAAVLGALGVALGAFGAHGLRERVEPRLLEVWETAVRYALVHALALLGTGLLARLHPGRAAAVAGALFTLGVAVFSGTLVLLVLTGARWLGAITPLGGVALIAGWVALGVAAGGVDPAAGGPGGPAAGAG